MKKKTFQHALIIAFLLVSCKSASETQAEATPTPYQPLEAKVETGDEIPTIEPESAAVINPLTGLEVEDPEILDRRPIMVKVSNYPQYGRPHAGLSSADMVFEYYIGLGQNRFLALYYGQDSSQIGPVRSGRFIDPQLVLMYSGVLAYGSADEDTDAEINARLGEYAISNLEAGEPVFTGTDTHSVVGVFANSGALSDFVSELELSNGTPDLPGMVFSNNIPNHGKYADQVNILYNYYNIGQWRYDSASGKYLRWIEYFEDEEDTTYDMIPLVDRNTNEQLGFSNVMIIFADHTKEADSRYLIDIWGNNKGRKAYFFRDGQIFEGKWKADNDTDPMQFFSDNGEPFTLKPGNTWIAVASQNSTFKEISSSVWEMFYLDP